MNSDGTFKEEAAGLGDRVVGDVKDAAGAVTGNERLEREGEAQASYGTARQKNNRLVSGLFNDRESAENAYNSAINRGYTKDDVNLLMSDETRDKHFNDNTEMGSKALEGAGVGSAVGGTLGAIIGGIAAIGTNLILPGLGLIVAGPLAAALAGAGAGGLTGGLVGALIGSGIPEDRAQAYEQGLRDGKIMVGVNPRTDEDAAYFEDEWRNYRGEQIYR